MAKTIIHTLMAILLIACAQVARADRQTRYVPGTGTYGVSTEKYQCPRCGKILHKGSGHACTVETPSRSSGHSSGGYQASDAEGDALISSNPDLLINKSYVGTPNYSETVEDEAPAEESEDDDNDWEWIVGVIAIVGLLFWFSKN